MFSMLFFVVVFFEVFLCFDASFFLDSFSTLKHTSKDDFIKMQRFNFSRKCHFLK